jgi:hypothetical protein
MSDLLARLLTLCLLRIGPQDLPCSRRILLQLLGGLVTLQFVFALLLERTARLPLDVLLMLGLLLLPIQLLLALSGHRERFVQTAIGFAGAGLLFSLAMLPVVLVLSRVDPERIQTEGASGPQALAVLAWLGLTTWKLAIDTHLWRHALQRPLPLAVAISLGLFLVELAVARQLGNG